MTVLVTHLVREIDRIYAANPDSSRAEEEIEEYLHRELEGEDILMQRRVLTALQRAFAPPTDATLGGESFVRFCSLLLGREVDPAELSSQELMERLAEALDTVFSSLNELVLSINMTLLEGDRGGETIRHIIGRQLEDDRGGISLEEYIGRIKSAFLVSHQGFCIAAQEMAARILQQLDPQRFTSAGESGFKFGLMKKSDAFERYNQAFINCKKWYDSGRCMEEFLREFEKQCRQLAKNNPLNP